MAVMKKKGGKEVGAISTASLPDIIFMILFFFMISTTMRETENLVRFSLPVASEVSKLEKKSLVSYILVGEPNTPDLRAQFGTAPRIQLNDSFSRPESIRDFVASERDKLSERDRVAMTISIKADKSVYMGIITDIKQELRRADALKISYASELGLAMD